MSDRSKTKVNVKRLPRSRIRSNIVVRPRTPPPTSVELDEQPEPGKGAKHHAARNTTGKNAKTAASTNETPKGTKRRTRSRIAIPKITARSQIPIDGDTSDEEGGAIELLNSDNDSSDEYIPPPKRHSPIQEIGDSQSDDTDQSMELEEDDNMDAYPPSPPPRKNTARKTTTTLPSRPRRNLRKNNPAANNSRAGAKTESTKVHTGVVIQEKSPDANRSYIFISDQSESINSSPDPSEINVVQLSPSKRRPSASHVSNSPKKKTPVRKSTWSSEDDGESDGPDLSGLSDTDDEAHRYQKTVTLCKKLEDQVVRFRKVRQAVECRKALDESEKHWRLSLIHNIRYRKLKMEIAERKEGRKLKRPATREEEGPNVERLRGMGRMRLENSEEVANLLEKALLYEGGGRELEEVARRQGWARR